MVDEVAKNIITVPMCLRDEGTQGLTPHHITLSCAPIICTL